MSMSRPYSLTIVVPAYNEQEVLPTFHRRLSDVLETLPCDAEVIYVNDGSSDATLAVLRSLRASDGRVAIVNLSRNFGKEIALTAGLDHASGDAVIVIDADLQDPPELIPRMVEIWRTGAADVVYARRTSRNGETWLKKATAHAFYRVIQKVSRVQIPEDTGDFRLMNRRAVQAVLELREQHRFMKGLFVWVGFHQEAIHYERDRRFAGETKWNYWRLWNFALEGITSFTTAPLKVATYLGLIVALWAFLYAVWVIYKTLKFGEPVQGYPTLMVVILFLGGVQLMSLGLIGEYIGRMFDETKRRPLYVLESYQKSRSALEERVAPLSSAALNRKR
jgi:glycosyltransferase involved in cell wall biosynthesis